MALSNLNFFKTHQKSIINSYNILKFNHKHKDFSRIFLELEKNVNN